MGRVDEMFAAMKALYEADTGSGGLSGSGNARVLHFLRMGGPNAGGNSTVRPRVEVEFIDNDHRPAGIKQSQLLVRFHVITHRDEAFAAQNAIADRHETVFEKSITGATTASGYGTFDRWFQAPSRSQDELHYVGEYTTHVGPSS